MVKLIYCMRRLPRMSRVEFQRHWLETHGPLVRTRAAAFRLRRYVQVHTIDSPVNDLLRENRHAAEAYDGVAELWWDSIEDMVAGTASPEGRAAVGELLEDEKRFIDFERSSIWLAQDHVIVG